jgi:pantothenate kinase
MVIRFSLSLDRLADALIKEGSLCQLPLSEERGQTRQKGWGRVVAICGSGGMGKKALAAEVMSHVIQQKDFVTR